MTKEGILKTSKNESVEKGEEYRQLNREIRNDMKKAKEDWISEKCNDIETNLSKTIVKKHINW